MPEHLVRLFIFSAPDGDETADAVEAPSATGVTAPEELPNDDNMLASGDFSATVRAVPAGFGTGRHYRIAWSVQYNGRPAIDQVDASLFLRRNSDGQGWDTPVALSGFVPVRNVAEGHVSLARYDDEYCHRADPADQVVCDAIAVDFDGYDVELHLREAVLRSGERVPVGRQADDYDLAP